MRRRRPEKRQIQPDTKYNDLSVAKFINYIMENGKIVMEGKSEDLIENEDVKEFYLGGGNDNRKSFKDLKSYKRRKRWL